ncbi:MAG: phosphonate ABC transporter, permease protein PhnE [Caldilineaceae bacterium]|nr:phosphonate ABC transporter, permease protein PhnE [Caldilineaceae bacterium]
MTTKFLGATSAATPTTELPLDQLRRDLLQPWPRVTIHTTMFIVALFALLAWGLNGTNARPGELIAGLPNILDFIRRLFPPRFDLIAVPLVIPAFQFFGLTMPTLGLPTVTFPFPEVMQAITETVQMALIGSLLGIMLAAPFGLLAARNTAPHPWIYQGTRMFLNANRSLPEIVYALIFVAAVGLGPFGGVLALAIGSIGSVGKLYAEAIEQIDPQQVLAVRATGANPLLTFRYAVLPQALPVIASYSLLLFESNIRHASILGIVGAGGIGFIIGKYMALFQYTRLMGAVILLVLTVTLIDRLSDSLRKRII